MTIREGRKLLKEVADDIRRRADSETRNDRTSKKVVARAEFLANLAAVVEHEDPRHLMVAED